MKMSRFKLLCFILILIAFNSCSTFQNPQCESCNIILIIISCFRADHTNMENYYRNTTPFLATLAEESLYFENAYAQGSYTYTSIPSIFTSQLPYSLFGKNKNELPMPNSALTIAEILKNNSYKTVAFTGGMYFSREFNMDQGFDVWNESNFLLSENYNLAKEWLLNNKRKRFFMLIHGYELHNPLNKGHRFFKINVDTKINGTDKEFKLMEQEYFKKGYINLSNDEINEYITLYDDNIRWVDQSTSEFFNFLKTSGLLNNTIVVITSENGEELLDHRAIQHGFTLYNEVLHVPLIIHFPSGLRLNYSGNVRLLDLTPTLLDIVGVSYREYGFQGASLMPLIHKKTELRVFSETPRNQRLRSIMIKNWKLIVNLDTNKRELYNLLQDKKEKINLCEKFSEICTNLTKELDIYFDSLPLFWDNNRLNLTPEMKALLKNKGYWAR